MEVIMTEIEKVKPYENNPRKNDDAVNEVAKSIETFGFKNPIIVDKNFVIIAGHTRLKASIQLGLTHVPVIVAEDLTEVALKYKDYDLTLVKLPHHGSSANISMEMLEALNCRSFLISTKQSSKRPSPDTIQLLGKYGVKNQTITIYGNYKWPRFQENYEHLKIIALQKYDNAEYIEGVKLYCEDKR